MMRTVLITTLAGCALLPTVLARSQNPPVEITTHFYDSVDCSGNSSKDRDVITEEPEQRGMEGKVCGSYIAGTHLMLDSQWKNASQEWMCSSGCCKSDVVKDYTADFTCVDFCEVSNTTETEIDWESIDSHNGKMGAGVILEFIVMYYCIVGLMIVCDAHLTPALETLCVRWMVSEDVAGATFMAIGSAAPEIVINMIAVVRSIGPTGDPEAIQLGVSAVLGSGIVSFLLSTGVCAFYAPKMITLKRRPLLRDCGSYLIMVILLIIFFDDGIVGMGESATLVVLYIIYVLIVAFAGKIRRWYIVKTGGTLKKRTSFVHANDDDEELLGGEDAIEMTGPGDKDLEKDGSKGNTHDDGDADDEEEEEEMGAFLQFSSWPLRMMFKYTCPDAEEGSKYEMWYPFTALMSFIWIAVFSFLLSTIVSRWSALMGIPTIILGATLVAMGGEVPDTIQSVAVVKRGYGGLAVANCVGSKVANVGLGLGASWLLSNALGYPIKVCNAYKLKDLAIFHTGAIILFLALTLIEALVLCKKKAEFGRQKGTVLLCAYPIIVGGYIFYSVYAE